MELLSNLHIVKLFGSIEVILDHDGPFVTDSAESDEFLDVRRLSPQAKWR